MPTYFFTSKIRTETETMQQEQTPTKELIETFKDKTPEEITSYLYKRLEESHVLMPRGIRGNNQH